MKDVAVVHQPYFLPWLGYFNKLAHAANLVILDNVKYRDRGYDNRVHIKNMHGERSWLTVPVNGTQNTMLRDVRVTDGSALDVIAETVRRSYAPAPFYSTYWPRILAALRAGSPSLLDLNTHAIRELLDILGMGHVRLWRASAVTQTDDPTERIIACCKLAASTRLIMGGGGSTDCHDLDQIRGVGIDMTVQDFYSRHPVYPQIRGSFVSHLSVVDPLFNIGAKQTRDLIYDAWRPTW